MNSAINELVRSVVRKNALSECSISELERLVAQYPYFGPAQFLLAQKLKEENSPLYEQQYQKAILYFKDHLWFDYLSRNEDASGTIRAAIADQPAEIVRPAEEIVSLAETVQETKEVADNSINIALEKDHTDTIQESASDIPALEEPVNGSAPADHDNDSVKQPGMQASNKAGLDEDELQPAPPDQATDLAKAPHLPPFKIEPLSAKAATLTFEPYHTIDYFASQGIRVKEEEKPKDRFSQQLKSFTEWLKAIKKAPESEITATPTAPEDPKVTRMAEHSLVDRDVVTEAMADVWEQQGNKEKAIETYGKLSLLNPSKSAYFAAKIEHLKHP